VAEAIHKLDVKRGIARAPSVAPIAIASMQQFWKHEVPKTKENVGERINLTFRKIGEQ
jgi:hypothetical protein